MLAARLDMPTGPVKAYALFAHCFTCSKDIFAAARVSAALAEYGFAVLRFDFTGLGASEGEFANSNFSSNVEDLRAAVDYLRKEYNAPKLLVGHSLGGAAVLSAAGEIPEVKAIATIGAPADAAHVIHNFGAKIDEIDQEGEAQVSLAGRNFTIKKQFLEDLKAQNMQQRLSKIKQAVIIFHAPQDNVVGIENAADIFQALKHPKSFVSLDDADHLLSRKQDAIYVAQILSAWAQRYIDSADEDIKDQSVAEGLTRVIETGDGKFQQDVISGRHYLRADEPKSYGGDDTGPSPYDFLNIALGACTSMTIRMYAARKKISLEQVSVDVSHEKIHAKDCEECDQSMSGRIDRFDRSIKLSGDLSDDDQKKLIDIADRCPVHKTLEQSSVIRTQHIKE